MAYTLGLHVGTVTYCQDGEEEMADPTNFYDLMDSVVKILGGASAGGIVTYLANYHLKKQEQAQAYQKETREVLREVASKVQVFHTALSDYWAQTRNAAFKRDKKDFNDPITDTDRNELSAAEQIFYSAFSTLGESHALLLLIGGPKSAQKLNAYREAADEFFKTSHLENEKCTQENLDRHKENITQKKDALFLSLHNHLKNL